MTMPTNGFELLEKCQSWLLHEGFQRASWPSLGEVFYKNCDINPDQHPGAKLVVFAKPDTVTNPSILKSTSAQIFNQADEFFRKKHRLVGSAKSFLLFILFPVANVQADLVAYIEKTKPSATSFRGSQVPILLGLDRQVLHYFTPTFIPQTTGRSNLTDLVEWLFGLPLLAEGNVLEQATGIVNSLRSVPMPSTDPTPLDPRKMSLDKIKSLANQLYYEGSTLEDVFEYPQALILILFI